jgi:polyisoprenoid-binding protein YceI
MLTLVPVLLALAAAGAAEDGVYAVDPAASRVQVHVGRSGLLKFAGHEHEVAGPVAEGRVTVDTAQPERSSVSLTLKAADLRVAPGGENPDELPKIQETMAGPKVLDVARFPTISFVSKRVQVRPAGPGAYELTLSGDLTLHGVVRGVTLPLKVQVLQDTLTATGGLTVRQTVYEMQPVSVAGVVKVRDDVAVTFTIVARRTP